MLKEIIDFISQPWPWYITGPLISLVMFLMFYFGNTFGISSNLRTICSMLGAGKSCDFFDFDWKNQIWNLVFVVGMILGGFIAKTWLNDDEAIALSQETIARLKAANISVEGFVPESLFSWEALGTLRGWIMLVLGGFMVGFGTRYGGGCTSGHAITGLSNLQLPSLIAVIGFFVGGLIVTFLVLPFLLTL